MLLNLKTEIARKKLSQAKLNALTNSVLEGSNRFGGESIENHN